MTCTTRSFSAHTPKDILTPVFMYLGMSGKEDEGDQNLSEEDEEDGGDPDSGEDPRDEKKESQGEDADPDETGTETEPGADQPESERVEEIEDELQEKKKEIEDLRHKLEPKIQEAEDEIAELREELETEIADHERRLDELREELAEVTEASERPEQTAEPSRGSYFPTPPSKRPPKAAGVILGVTGFLGLVASLGAGGLEVTLGMTSRYVTSLSSDALIATAAIAAAVSIAVFVGGWWSYNRKKWYYTVFAALVCSVVLSPVGIPALVLVAVSERAFD